MKVLTIAAIKGGVGKSTIAAHVAAALADMDNRTLLLDLDAQAQATVLSGIDMDEGAPCIGDALERRQAGRIGDVILTDVRPNLDVGPASLGMATQERDIYSWGLRLSVVSKVLAKLNYDVVVIDTPPHIGAYTEAALHAADLTQVPVPAQAGALQGLEDLKLTWEEMQDGKGGKLMAVVNLWDKRTSATNEAMDAALSKLKVPLLKTRIPRVEKINQTAMDNSLIIDTAPSNIGAVAFRELAEELTRKLGSLRK